MARIYLTGSAETKGYATGSGIINNPVRILLQEKDNHAGSYPTIARSGDSDFTGRFSSTFDDAKIINFTVGDQVYPTILPVSSVWVSGNIADPSILQGLITAATASKGISDVHVDFTSGESIGPFKDSKVYTDSDSTFYQTGTETNILPGFSQRLSSKAILTLPINPVEKTSVHFSTGTNELHKCQYFVLRFISNTASDYTTAATGNVKVITLSVTGSAMSDAIPGISTVGSDPTSTYAFVFSDGTNEGKIDSSEKQERQLVTVDITGKTSRNEIAQAFVTGVNNLTNSPFYAEFTSNVVAIGNNYGDTASGAGIPNSHVFAVVRNRNPGIPLLKKSATSKINTTSLSFANGGPCCDSSEGFDTSVVLSGTVISFGTDQTRYSDNNLGIAAGINSGLAYYDWQNRIWQLIGDHTRGRNVDFYNTEHHIVASSTLAVIPAEYTSVGLQNFDIQPINNLIGLPCDTAGFPLATKFDATGSQLLCLSSSLTAPFLVEKISLDFSGAFGNGYFSDASEQAANVSFMLLLQRDQNVNASIDGRMTQINSYLTFATRSISDYNSSMRYTHDRRIVWIGRIGKTSLSLTELQDSYPEVYESCDTWISNTNLTGSFRISSPCRTFGKTPRATPFLDTREDYAIQNIFGINDGGRNLHDISDGRSFINSVIGSQLSSSLRNTFFDTNEGFDFMKTYTDVVRTSPFVLLPNDKLILAVANQKIPYASKNLSYEPKVISEHGLQLLAGDSSISLFGSFLRDGKFVDAECNQPLNSDSIHEDLHEQIFDQFDVEPYFSLTGSYVDLIITGSMLATPLGDPTAVNVRKVQASVAAGQAGATGSLQRFVKLNAANELYYDSLVRNFTGSDGAPLLSVGSYGLTDALSKQESIHFRRDRCGQFRDMLEQSPHVARILGNSTSHPIEIKFYSRPSKDGKGRTTTRPIKTHSQNLSHYATSSLPYFDGVVKERTDNPDLTLVELPAITIS